MVKELPFARGKIASIVARNPREIRPALSQIAASKICDEKLP